MAEPAGTKDREALVLSAIVGFAVGDAIGVPREHDSRAAFRKNPLTMLEAGIYPAGTWSDDTSLTLCTMEAIIGGRGRVDLAAILATFARWLLEGHLTPWGTAIGVGKTTQRAIMQHLGGTPPLLCGGEGERDNGNGAVMRIVPAAILGHFQKAAKAKQIREIASLTHRHPRSLAGALLYSEVFGAVVAARAPSKQERLREGLNRAEALLASAVDTKAEMDRYQRVFWEDFSALPEESIPSSGYVVDTVEAALWCFLQGASYRESVLRAVNLGGDADTIAALTGGLAGVYYGYEAIPEEWRQALAKKETIHRLCREFAAFLP